MKEIFPILPFKVTEKIDMKFKISLKIHALEYIMYVIFFYIENGINPVFFSVFPPTVFSIFRFRRKKQQPDFQLIFLLCVINSILSFQFSITFFHAEENHKLFRCCFQEELVTGSTLNFILLRS